MMKKLYDLFLKYPKICTDTRKIEKDSLFFALKGPNFNANAFAQKALDLGSAYAVIDEENFKTSDRFIVVDNVLESLQYLATYHRKQVQIPFLAITGSNGKTTTKELIRAVLSRKYNITATEGNLNNHIGVPLTVLSVNQKTELAIIEMGANHVGEIARLCQIAQPNFGIITNIGKAHLEGFGGFEGVIKAKSELYNYLRENKGTIFLNNENDLLKKLAVEIKKITYGTSEQCDLIGKILDQDKNSSENNSMVTLQWKKQNEKEFGTEVKTQIFGFYNLENILASIAVGLHFDVDRKDINQALEDYQPSNKRSQILKKGTNTLILDCYNANPVSMTAAIKNFAKLDAKNKIVVLGDMLELGDYSQKEHENIVELLKDFSFSKIFLVGKEFSRVKVSGNFLVFSSTEELKQYFLTEKVKNSYILIKGSRGIQLENLLQVLPGID